MSSEADVHYQNIYFIFQSGHVTQLILMISYQTEILMILHSPLPFEPLLLQAEEQNIQGQLEPSVVFISICLRNKNLVM